MTRSDLLLTPEQRDALRPEVRLIEAGPGAGKTRTVVARYRERAVDGCGVALLSFTNAAVDVARSRMLDTPTLIGPPNYVGTFDQFFHRYVLTVDVHRRFGQGARYVSSWDDLPGHLAVVRPPSGGVGFRLSCWVRQSDTEWNVDDARLNRSERLAWDPLSEWSRGQVNALGSQRIAGLCRAHLYDTTESRARSLAALADSETSYLARLCRRFGARSGGCCF